MSTKYLSGCVLAIRHIGFDKKLLNIFTIIAQEKQVMINKLLKSFQSLV